MKCNTYFMNKCKGKGHPITRHEGPEGVQMYNSTLPSTSTLDGRWVVNATPRPLYPPGKDPVPIVQEAGWAPGPVWTGAEDISPPTGIRSPDRPARSESLYRLSYPGPMYVSSITLNLFIRGFQLIVSLFAPNWRTVWIEKLKRMGK